MTTKKTVTTKNDGDDARSLADVLSEPDLPAWKLTLQRLDLAAAVVYGDEEALAQHRAAWAAHLRRRDFTMHLRRLEAEADTARREARRSLDQPDLSPAECEELLTVAYVAVERATRYRDWLHGPVLVKPGAPEFHAHDRSGEAARTALRDGMKRRGWQVALVCARELAALELGELLNQAHPLPAGITVEELRQHGQPVEAARSKLADISSDLRDLDTGRSGKYHADRRTLLAQRHKLTKALQPATAATP